MLQPVKKLIQKDPFLFSAIIAFLIFIILSINFSFTYSTDDFSYLARSHSVEGLTLESFSGYVSRLPIWAIFTWIGFSSHFYDYYHFAMSFWFFIFSLSFAYLVKEILSILKIQVNHENDKYLIPIVLIPFLLYPTHHEVLYWATDFAYVIGLSFLTLGLKSINPMLKIIFFTLSFLTSEMYVFPLFSILFIDTFFNRKSYQNLIIFIIVSLIYFTIRKLLIPFYGDYSVGSKLTSNFRIILGNIYATIAMNFGMHFYKTIWSLTIPYWITIAFPLFNFCKDIYQKSSRNLVVIALSIPGSFCFYWLMSYGAARALFGSQNFINALIVAALFFYLKSSTKKSFTHYLIPLVILAIFLTFSIRTFMIKDKNYQVIQVAKMEVREALNQCNNTCIDTIPYKNLPIYRDWVMHPDYWNHFVKWSKLSP